MRSQSTTVVHGYLFSELAELRSLLQAVDVPNSGVSLFDCLEKLEALTSRAKQNNAS